MIHLTTRGRAAAAAAICCLGITSAGCVEQPEPYIPEPIPDVVGMLERMEARLIVARARVQYWEELAERSRGVTEVACRNLDWHVSAEREVDAMLSSGAFPESAGAWKRLASADWELQRAAPSGRSGE